MPSLSMNEVREKYPRAYKKLPSSYRADSCLEFYTTEEGLFADYDLGGTFKWIGKKWVKTAD